MHAPPYLLPNLTQLMIFVLVNRQILTITLLAEARNLAHTDRNADGKFRHICRMSQDQTIRVTEEFSDNYDGNFHYKYRSFRQNIITSAGVFRQHRSFPTDLHP